MSEAKDGSKEGDDSPTTIVDIPLILHTHPLFDLKPHALTGQVLYLTGIDYKTIVSAVRSRKLYRLGTTQRPYLCKIYLVEPPLTIHCAKENIQCPVPR